MDGATAAEDGHFVKFDNSPVAGTPSPGEIYEETHNTYVVDFQWTKPGCDPWDTLGLASYNFTVNYDPTKLAVVDRDYHYGFMGPSDGTTGAFYAPIIDGSGMMTFASGNYVALGYGDGDLAWAEFKVIDVAALSSITITSTYLDTNNNVIAVTTTPLDLVLQDTQVPSIVSHVAPAVVSDANAGCFDAGLQIVLTVEAQAHDNFDLKVIRYKWDDDDPTSGTTALISGLDGTDDGTTTAVAVPTTGLSEDTHTLYLFARDEALNWSAPYAVTVEVDRTGPVLDAFTVVDKDGCAPVAGYTDEAVTTANLTNSDATAVMMQLAYIPGLPWTSSPPVTFDGDDFDFPALPSAGNYTCYARLYDAVGNCGGDLTVNMEYDDTAPTGPTAPLLFYDLAGNPITKTAINAIKLRPTAYVVGAGEAYESKVSEDQDSLACAYPTDWVDFYALGAPYRMDYTLSDGDDFKTVYFAERDSAGNMSSILSGTIELDQTGPTMAEFTLVDVMKNRTECVDDRLISGFVRIDPADTADAVEFHWGFDDGGPYPNVITLTRNPGEVWDTVATITLPDVQGTHTVYAVLVDDVDNEGPQMSDDIELDTIDPTMDDILVNSDALWETGSATVTVSVLNPSGDAILIHMGEAPGVYNTTLVFDGSDVPYTFLDATECTLKRVYAILEDCAGRTCAEEYDGFYFDFTDPSVDGVTITGIGDGVD